MDRTVLFNKNGGLYRPGKTYDIEKKVFVGMTYMQMLEEDLPAGEGPTAAALARRTKVSWDYASKIVTEIEIRGTIIPPDMSRKDKHIKRGVGSLLQLTVVEEWFLLALRAEKPNRPNNDYIIRLYEHHGKLVSSTFISRWFKYRFHFNGCFKKPNLIPLDKFKIENLSAYVEFRQKINGLKDKSRYHFIDEKHLVNKDIYAKKVRADPLTGRTDSVPVSGDFRDAYNLLAIISSDPNKEHLIEYSIGPENGTSASFMAFIEYLLAIKWFRHNDILVLDNAAVHIGGHSDILEDLLWELEVDGRPLNCLLVHLPTRSPELNPIELVFNILVQRLNSSKYMTVLPSSTTVVKQTALILDGIPNDMVLRCCSHCGYLQGEI
jgi:transposase